MKSYQAKEHITLYGKGRKAMKPVLQFKSLGFPSNIMAVCKGFEKPTPIQAQCWPVLASGRDVIGIAETGSGKTLAFTIPALAHLQHRTATEGRAAKGSPRMLIIAPTRCVIGSKSTLAPFTLLLVEQMHTIVKHCALCIQRQNAGHIAHVLMFSPGNWPCRAKRSQKLLERNAALQASVFMEGSV